MKLRTLLVAAIAILVIAPKVSADLIDLTAGSVRFRWNPDTGLNSLSTSFDSDISFSFLPLLRYQSPSGEIRTYDMGDGTFGNIQQDSISSIANSSGGTGSQNVVYRYQDGASAIEDILNVDMEFSLAETVFGNPRLEYSIAITNVSGVQRPDVELFVYFDWDLINSQNSVDDFSLNEYRGFLQKASASAPFNNAFHGTDNLHNWEVATFDSIETKLLNGGSLSNSGTPFPVDDATAAFGWTIGTMSAGDTFSVNMLISSIPEPSTAMFFAAASIALLGTRRRLNR